MIAKCKLYLSYKLPKNVRKCLNLKKMLKKKKICFISFFTFYKNVGKFQTKLIKNVGKKCVLLYWKTAKLEWLAESKL